MSPSRIAFTVIALLLSVSAIALSLTGSVFADGIWLYAVVAIVVITLTRTVPGTWPGCLFDASNASRIALTQRLQTQLAALVCLLTAQVLSGKASATLSEAGVLLFIHTLVLARLSRRVRSLT